MTPEELAQVHKIAQAFHETYERLAPEYGWVTQKESAMSWEDIPVENKLLMINVVAKLFNDGIIKV